MVLKRRLDCGSSYGFNFPNIPKAPRSCRRKTITKKPNEDSQICAFDLLASLAGKLLQESESSSASNNAFEVDDQNGVVKEIKQEREDECKPLKSGFSDQGNFDAKSTYENTSEKCLLNKFSFFEDDGILERTSIPGYGRVHDLKPAGCEDKKEFCNLPIGLGGTSGETGESGDVSVNNEFEQKLEGKKGLADGGLIASACCKKDITELCVTFPESVHSDRDRKLSACTKPVPNASFARRGNLTKLGSRDDDEKFYRSYKFSSKFKPYRPPPRIGDRRIRKLLSSKYWKAVPKLKDYEYTRADGGLRSLYRKRKACYGYNRWQSDIVYKRRRSSDRGSVVTSDGGLSSESVTNSPEKGDTANGVLSPSKGLRSKDSHVKFSIKSFKIPELFIEVPETATVGSLKRTVLEAVTALLGGGVRVGVLVQGKKIRDDSKTLLQTGLSCQENLGNLGFTLEPGPGNTPSLLCSEDPLVSIPSDSTNLSNRSPDSPMLDSGIPSSFPDSDGLKNSGDLVENNNCELVPYQSGVLADEPASDSRALVPVPALDVEALAIVPVNQKPKRSELTHRRTRRPFSVFEVEALVQAVEELGTGRWRDVKLRAFENADHRTYVDLKDKWKTLVHTASISPQQRRGEPVPQELLDRVLAAHSYWSQHQAKQHGKHQDGPPKARDNPAADWNRVGATELQTGSM